MITGVDDVIKGFDSLRESVKNPDLNLERANEARKMLIRSAKNDDLGLNPITEATEIIQGKSHPREYNKGDLVRASIAKQNPDGSASLGYFPESGKIGDLPAEVIARLQTTGYKIPTTGEKGARVRAFLAAKGIFLKKTTKFLRVPPSPFLFILAKLYEENRDETVIRRWIKRNVPAI